MIKCVVIVCMMGCRHTHQVDVHVPFVRIALSSDGTRQSRPGTPVTVSSGPDRPGITCVSAVLEALFAGRSNVYAYRWENTAEGTKSWAPKRRPGTTRDNPEYLPLTDEVVSAHLTKENPATCGFTWPGRASGRRSPAAGTGEPRTVPRAGRVRPSVTFSCRGRTSK
jgi:hypothetical protein